MAKPHTIKVKSMLDLANVAVAAQISLVHRLNIDSKSIFYIPFPNYDSIAIYYYETEGQPKGRYLLFNRFTGEVQLSENYVNDSKYVLIPIVEVEEQEVLPKEILDSYSKSKKNKSKKQKNK
ncbi:MAG: hypothetical protein NZ954_06450 [Thermofilaceae archaeon]|nr:hypothetical protein [Thermofilaceae archaeon]MDW8003765.1 hypothetical protein [Thermofilaceae archaeon]